MADDDKKDTRVMGYARVSTDDQDHALQIKALEEYGVDYIFQETGSGAKMNRPELEAAFKAMHESDTLVVWKLDRLGRSVKGVLEAVEEMERRGVDLVVLTEPIDTKTPWGRMVMTILLALAQMERELISERTKSGIAAQRAAGKTFGRNHSIIDNPKRLAAMRILHAERGLWNVKPSEALSVLNKADRKAAAITSPETFRRWRREGCKGLDAEDLQNTDQLRSAIMDLDAAFRLHMGKLAPSDNTCSTDSDETHGFNLVARAWMPEGWVAVDRPNHWFCIGPNGCLKVPKPQPLRFREAALLHKPPTS